MALLEGRPKPPRLQRPVSPHVGGRAQSPAVAQSPLRSMLDIAPAGGASATYGSMLDPSSPRRTASRGPVSPVLSSPPLSARSPAVDPESAYQFGMRPTIEAHSMPKRVTQAGKKSKQQTRTMSSVYGNSSDLLGTARDPVRHGSLGGVLGIGSSTSPAPGRSESPGGRILNNNSLNMMSDPHRFVTDSGKVVDMNSAYRRLSDAALLQSGGSLSTLPSRQGSDPSKGESLAPGGGIRLATDDYGEEEAAIESSEESESDGTSGGESWAAQRRRGRRRTRQNDVSGGGKRMPKSLLAAAEDERRFLHWLIILD
jgi:hypothetical protein